uniref:Uncharacterized protein n=1 Tax=Lactuca sativa TaxID=4236 RepID=A0A9R1WTI9_LACSA|nr:hypothetical protein LSAT_V11C900497740 [Lactuca sativa]
MGGLGDLDEDRQELDELEEQLGESVEYCHGLGKSVLGLDELDRRTSTFPGPRDRRGLRETDLYPRGAQSQAGLGARGAVVAGEAREVILAPWESAGHLRWWKKRKER